MKGPGRELEKLWRLRMRLLGFEMLVSELYTY